MVVAKMERISWKEKIRIKEVLRRMNEVRSTMKAIRKQKAKWIEHILKRNCLQKLLIEGS